MFRINNKYNEKINCNETITIKWDDPNTWDDVNLNLFIEQLPNFKDVKKERISSIFKENKTKNNQTGLSILLKKVYTIVKTNHKDASIAMNAIYKYIVKPTYDPTRDKENKYEDLQIITKACIHFPTLVKSIWFDIIDSNGNKDPIGMAKKFLKSLGGINGTRFVFEYMLKINSFKQCLFATNKSGETHFSTQVLPSLNAADLVGIVNLFDEEMLRETITPILKQVKKLFSEKFDVNLYLELWKILFPKYKNSSTELIDNDSFINDFIKNLPRTTSYDSNEAIKCLNEHGEGFTASLTTSSVGRSWLCENVDLLLLFPHEIAVQILMQYWQSLDETHNINRQKDVAIILFNHTSTAVIQALFDQVPSFTAVLLSDEFKDDVSASFPKKTRAAQQSFLNIYLGLFPLRDKDTYDKLKYYIKIYIEISLLLYLPSLDTNKEGWQDECLKFFETIDNYIQDDDAELKTLFLRTYNEYFMESPDKMPLALAMASDPALTQFLMAYAYYVPRPQSVEETYKYYSILVKMCLLADPISSACYDAARIQAYNPNAKNTLIGQLNKENRQPVYDMDTKPLLGTYFTYLENTYNKAAKHVIRSRAKTHMDEIKRNDIIREDVVYLPNAIGEFFSIIEPTAPLKPSEERDEHWNSKCSADESNRAPSTSSIGNAQKTSNFLGKLFSKAAPTALFNPSKTQTTVDEFNSKCSANESERSQPIHPTSNRFAILNGLWKKDPQNTIPKVSSCLSQEEIMDEHSNSKPSASVDCRPSESVDVIEQNQLNSTAASHAPVAIATPVETSTAVAVEAEPEVKYLKMGR